MKKQARNNLYRFSGSRQDINFGIHKTPGRTDDRTVSDMEISEDEYGCAPRIGT